MKKPVHTLAIIFICLIVPFSIVRAQYAIPSFEVELEQENTTFEEDEVLLQLESMEERQMIVKVEDESPSQSTWAIVKIYSLDGLDELGPYTVNEGTLLYVTIDEREWGVKVIDFLSGCIISTWIEY